MKNNSIEKMPVNIFLRFAENMNGESVLMKFERVSNRVEMMTKKFATSMSKEEFTYYVFVERSKGDYLVVCRDHYLHAFDVSQEFMGFVESVDSNDLNM